MGIYQVVYLTCTSAGCEQLCQSSEPKACWGTGTLHMPISLIANPASFHPHYRKGIAHLQGPSRAVVTPLPSAVMGSGRRWLWFVLSMTPC